MTIFHKRLLSGRAKLIKIGAKVVSHGRYVAFQIEEVAIPRKLFAAIVERTLRCDRRRYRCQHDQPGREHAPEKQRESSPILALQ